MNAKKSQNTRKNLHRDTCGHPSFTRQFVMGEPTQEYICAHCGKSMASIMGSQQMRH